MGPAEQGQARGGATPSSLRAGALRGFAGSWVLTGDPQEAPLRDAAVLLDAEERVVAVGEAQALRATYPTARWEHRAAVLMPGLVNAHLHLELSKLRGEVPGGRGFAPWAEQMLAARQRLLPEADREALEAAASELLAAGTVAVGEVTNSLAGVPALGGLPCVGRVFHEVFGLSRDRAESAWEGARGARGRLDTWPDNLSYVLAPHTAYTLAPDVLCRIVADARDAGQRTSLHVAEHAAERAYLTTGEGPFAELMARMGMARDWPAPGTDAVRYLARLSALGPQTLAVHLADARSDEIAAFAATGAPVVLCPRSNLHIEVKLPPLPGLLEAGLEPGLGTDSLASAPSLDVLEEAVALRERFPSVSPRVLIAMLTSWGARCLALDHQVGCLKPGLQPGLLAFAHADAPPADPAAFVLTRTCARPGAREVLARGPMRLLPRTLDFGGTP